VRSKDADIRTDGTKRSNYKHLKKLRLERRSTKSQYECIPQWTRRTHFKISAADKTVVTDETLIFALCRPSSKIPVSWQGDELDFARAKAERAEHVDLSTANNRTQPAFAGSYKTVAIPFGSRVTGYVPGEHALVKNRSFGDRFVEGIYLRADHDTPCIRMYCITSGSELLVQDFKSYPDEFPFRDPSCLLWCTPVILKD